MSGGHIFPVFDGLHTRGMRIIDTRHEQAAAFAAEAHGKLARGPGVAALTAGPGVTNGMSAITSAHFNGSPLTSDDLIDLMLLLDQPDWFDRLTAQRTSR